MCQPNFLPPPLHYRVLCETELVFVQTLFTSKAAIQAEELNIFTSIAAVQAKDSLFVSNLNGRFQEWLGSMATNRHGAAAFHFVAVSGCDQVVVGQAHAHGGTVDLLMTDVPDLVWVALKVPIGNSDYSSLSAVISMARRFQTCVLIGKFS